MARASFDLSRLPDTLKPAEAVQEPESTGALAEANRFEEGQISGPFGPKFVGYGEVPQVPLWRYVAEWTALLFVGSMLAMAAIR